jgi:hypothetical protein
MPNYEASIKWLSSSGQFHDAKATAPSKPFALTALLRKFALMAATKQAGTGKYTWQLDATLYPTAFPLTGDVATEAPAADMILNLVRVVGGMVVDTAQVHIKDASVTFVAPGFAGLVNLADPLVIAVATAYIDSNGNSGFSLISGYYVD